MGIKNTFALIALGASMTAGVANAGSMAAPVMEPEVIVEESGSSGDFVIPLLLLALLVAVATASSGGTAPD